MEDHYQQIHASRIFSPSAQKESFEAGSGTKESKVFKLVVIRGKSTQPECENGSFPQSIDFQNPRTVTTLQNGILPVLASQGVGRCEDV